MMDEAVPEWVAGYIGIPYATYGRDRSGIDCWGLFNLVMKEQLGREMPAYEGLPFHDTSVARDIGRDALAYASLFQPIEAGNETLGDGILIRVRGFPLHLAMVVAPGWMLHIEMHTDSCLSRYRDFAWERRISGFYRYR